MIRLIAISWIVFLIALSIAKSLGHAAWLWGGIESFLGDNRTMHFVMAGIMSLLCLLAVPERYQHGVVNPVILFLMTDCIVDELFQYFIPSRSFSAWDAASSCEGVLVFASPVILRRKFNYVQR